MGYPVQPHPEADLVAVCLLEGLLNRRVGLRGLGPQNGLHYCAQFKDVLSISGRDWPKLWSDKPT